MEEMHLPGDEFHPHLYIYEPKPYSGDRPIHLAFDGHGFRAYRFLSPDEARLLANELHNQADKVEAMWNEAATVVDPPEPTPADLDDDIPF